MTLKPYVTDADFTLYNADVMDALAALPDGSVDCCVTSPPYWGLRDYGVPGQLGLEPTPEEYVARMVTVFREVRRVLAKHGTLWLNIGDSYATSPKGPGGDDKSTLTRGGVIHQREVSRVPPRTPGIKPKDLVGIPWLLAFALRADGWYLRADIIWAKPNPMPESVTDRPTKAHEYLFLLSKRPRYFFDQEAIREPAEWAHWGKQTTPKVEGADEVQTRGVNGSWVVHRTREEMAERYPGRNVRSVWEIATQPYPEAHFATYPEELVRRCILAGCPPEVCRECGKPRERLRSIDYDNPGNRSSNGARLPEDHRASGVRTMASGKRLEKRVETIGWTDCGHDAYRPGVVLDPFLGSGTTALVARKHGRACIGIELNESYCELAARRLQQQSLLAAAE